MGSCRSRRVTGGWVLLGSVDDSVIYQVASKGGLADEDSPVRDSALHADVVPSCEPPSLAAASKPTHQTCDRGGLSSLSHHCTVWG